MLVAAGTFTRLWKYYMNELPCCCSVVVFVDLVCTKRNDCLFAVLRNSGAAK